MGGCLKQDNVKRAEDAIEKGDWHVAARFYDLNTTLPPRINSTQTKMMLTQAANSKAGNQRSNGEVEKNDRSEYGLPEFQSKALNELGNLLQENK